MRFLTALGCQIEIKIEAGTHKAGKVVVKGRTSTRRPDRPETACGNVTKRIQCRCRRKTRAHRILGAKNSSTVIDARRVEDVSMQAGDPRQPMSVAESARPSLPLSPRGRAN